MAERPRIALVSRELAPFGGGGIGTYVSATAAALREVAEVTIFTTDVHRRRYEELLAAGDPAIAEAAIRFVPEPTGPRLGEFYSHLHLWSADVLDALANEYPDGGPDLVEFPDFLGEGFVSVQARQAGDPRLARATVCIRLYTTAEMTSLLDGHISLSFEDRVTYEMERYALAHCDRVLWPGGDVLATYRRRLGDGGVASPVLLRHVLPEDRGESEGHGVQAPAGDDRTRLLYVGRLERRKGVLNLAAALEALPREDFTLTFVGADTDTAPLGQSMRGMLEVALADDPRVSFLDHLPRAELPRLFDEHDVVVLPSLWECWPAVGLEALQRNRPILATPTGGFTELVRPGHSGWLTQGTDPLSLAECLEHVLDSPQERALLLAEARPRGHLAALSDREEMVERYLELASAARPALTASPREPPLVSVVVPYFRLEQFLADALDSIARQTYPHLELIVVNDGSLRAEDGVVFELAERHGARLITQPNAGLGAARNAGVLQARGEYVFFLDADNMAAPSFIERCVEVLERDATAAYVTSWSRYVDERGGRYRRRELGYRPLGNWSPLLAERNVAGDAASVFRRSLFLEGFWFSRELTSYEDWAFFRALAAAGRYGCVIPEALIDYRVRADSMAREFGDPNLARLRGEMEAHLRDREEQWTAPSSP